MKNKWSDLEPRITAVTRTPGFWSGPNVVRPMGILYSGNSHSVLVCTYYTYHTGVKTAIEYWTSESSAAVVGWNATRPHCKLAPQVITPVSGQYFKIYLRWIAVGAFQVAPRSSTLTRINSQCHAIMMHDASYCFATPMSLYYKFVAVRQEGRIPQLLAQHSFLSKALVGEHRALFFL